MRPKAGERFRALRDTPVRGVITLQTPASGVFVGTLPRGEIVTIQTDPPEGVYARPERYEEMARLLVPPGDFANPLFGSYSLVISFESLEQDFQLVTSFRAGQGILLGVAETVLRVLAIPAMTVMACLLLLVYPFSSSVLTLFYHDLPVREEALDLELLGHQIGLSQTSS